MMRARIVSERSSVDVRLAGKTEGPCCSSDSPRLCTFSRANLSRTKSFEYSFLFFYSEFISWCDGAPPYSPCPGNPRARVCIPAEIISLLRVCCTVHRSNSAHLDETGEGHPRGDNPNQAPRLLCSSPTRRLKPTAPRRLIPEEMMIMTSCYDPFSVLYLAADHHF